jgi:hypothetical protein
VLHDPWSKHAESAIQGMMAGPGDDFPLFFLVVKHNGIVHVQLEFYFFIIKSRVI